MDRQWEILGIDHIAILVKNIERWKQFYVRLLGGEIFYETEDANPQGLSSMKLCGIKINDGRFSLALVEGIDREEKSQVTRFIERHGDHAVQHVAIGVRNVKAFINDMRKEGVNFLGELLERKDAFGPVKQIFSKKFDLDLDSDEAPFFEFVERPQKGKTFASADSFSDDFAMELYQSIEDAHREGDGETFINMHEEEARG